MPDRATHCPGCGIPITDCRVLFRERGEGETPEDFMREYARSSPYGHEQASAETKPNASQRWPTHFGPTCRVVERLEAQFLESQVSEVARMFGIPPHMLASRYRPLFPASGRIAWMWMSSETRRRSERRAWAVWDRKRRARRKR
jgi:hypothetical protein